MTLADVLAISAAQHGDRPAATELASGRTVTYAELDVWASAVGSAARRAGIRSGHRVGLVAGNTIGHVPAAFGLLEAGACVVPIAPGWRAAERAAVIADTDLNAIVVVETGRDVPSVQWLDVEREAPAGFAALEPAFIRFSSGTTADRKGVILSHGAVLGRVAAAQAVLGLGVDDRVFWTLPLAYHFAVTMVGYVRAGVHVLLAEDSLPQSIVDGIRATEASVLYAGPVFFERVARVCRAPLRSVRLALSTAAPLGEDVAARFEAATDVRLGQAYGVIEAGLPCLNLRQDGAPATSVGAPVPGYVVSVRDDAGQPCAGGIVGEVWVRGPGLFSGYYAPWCPADQACPEGWFRTGDAGLLDDAGRVTLVGRLKSTIIVAGMKVFPEEVEAVLDRLPGVGESRVVGEIHPRLGEVPVAEVVAVPGAHLEARRLTAACAAVLSAYKVPVEVRFVDAIPKTPGGKRLRRATGLNSRG